MYRGSANRLPELQASCAADTPSATSTTGKIWESKYGAELLVALDQVRRIVGLHDGEISLAVGPAQKFGGSSCRRVASTLTTIPRCAATASLISVADASGPVC